MPKKRSNSDVSKSWFCVFNNPQDHGYSGTPQEIVNALIETWIADNPQRTCAVSYCISADGLHHCHAVFEDVKAMRFTAIKKIFPSMHIEATKGNKNQAEDYINKQPPFDELGEQVIFINRHGEIKGAQGSRKDLEILEQLIQQGLTPDEIFDMSLSYRRFEKMIRDAYYSKRNKETPFTRDVTVYWHVGKSGSGKSYFINQLSEIHGERKIYLVGEYERGFDKYNGQPILFLDELRNQLRYDELLTIIGGLKVQTYARYSNIIGLWDEVHITSVYAPEEVYRLMVGVYDRETDTWEQLRRRISFVVYHYIENGEYLNIEFPMHSYHNYNNMLSHIKHIPPKNINADKSQQDILEMFGADEKSSPGECANNI